MDKNTSNSKYFGLFLIVSSLTCLGVWYQYEFKPSVQSQEKVATKTPNKKSQLQILWESDIEVMVSEKVFHKEITSINKVRLFLLDQNLHEHFDKLKAPFKFGKNGKNLLEVSFMSHHSELDKQDKLIVQYNLISKESGDMFWEHSRTIPLPEGILKN